MPESPKNQYATDKCFELIAGIALNISTATAELAMAKRRNEILVQHVAANHLVVDFDQLESRLLRVR